MFKTKKKKKIKGGERKGEGDEEREGEGRGRGEGGQEKKKSALKEEKNSPHLQQLSQSAIAFQCLCELPGPLIPYPITLDSTDADRLKE